jgi:hypothetical protein
MTLHVADNIVHRISTAAYYQMYMACHPGLAGTIIKAVNEHLLVFISYKDINPVNDGKADKVQFAVVTKFILSTHIIVVKIYYKGQII